MLAWAKRTSRVIDCNAIGGSVGGKGVRRVRAGEKVRAVRDHQPSPRRENEQAWTDHPLLVISDE